MQPLFYFPSTLVGIDDQLDSLRAITSILRPIQLSLNIFQDAHTALDFLNNYQSLLSHTPFLHPLTDGDNIGLPEHCPVNFNVLNIADLANIADRNSEISVLIIDFSMPNINGLTLCRMLKNSPMKKILLTGAHNYQEALTAFNEGVIDRFIQKDSVNLGTELREAIQTLTHQYFANQSRTLLTHLEASNLTPLSDPVFIQFFDAWRKENNIIEYYLIDKIGSFLGINAQGKKRYFIIHTKSSLNDFEELYGEAHNQIPELFHELQRKEKIPFFGIGLSAFDEEISNWNKHFYTANVLEGREIYYVAII